VHYDIIVQHELWYHSSNYDIIGYQGSRCQCSGRCAQPAEPQGQQGLFRVKLTDSWSFRRVTSPWAREWPVQGRTQLPRHGRPQLVLRQGWSWNKSLRLAVSALKLVQRRAARPRCPAAPGGLAADVTVRRGRGDRRPHVQGQAQHVHVRTCYSDAHAAHQLTM
jgi:hypothetical protein